MTLSQLFQRKEKGDSFADFVLDSSSYQKKKVLKKVVQKANEDQRKLVEKAKTV